MAIYRERREKPGRLDRSISFKVTSKEHEAIREEASRLGFSGISQFVASKVFSNREQRK